MARLESRKKTCYIEHIMLIQIISNEKIKDTNYLLAMEEYQKRLSAFTRVKTLSCEDYMPDKKEFVVQIDSYSDTITSEALSEQISQAMLSGYSTITFCLTPVAQADTSLCISKMNLPEPLTLTVLHEQLYRSFMIMNNRTYHK